MIRTYYYEGRDNHGSIVRGKFKANNIEDVVSYLEKRGIVPLEINLLEKGAWSLTGLLVINLRPNSVDHNEIMSFTRQLATLLNAGVSLTKAIAQLAQNTKSRFFSEILADVATKVAAGQSLANTLKRYPNVFPSLATSIIEVGENTGHLNEALLQVAAFLENSLANRRRLKSALRYPVFVIIAIVTAMITLNFLVIPKFALLFASFSLQLPLPTRIIISSSNFMVNHWLALTIVTVVLLFSINYLLSVPEIRYVWDKYKLKVPIFGPLQAKILLAQFAWTFSLVLRSGLPLIRGIILSGNATGNAFFSKQIVMMRDAIEHGTSLTAAANASKLFLPTITQMIEIGEESGKLDEILIEAAKYYETETDYDLRQLNELIEPLLLLIMGGLVVLLALGIYFPMWDLIKATNSF